MHNTFIYNFGIDLPGLEEKYLGGLCPICTNERVALANNTNKVYICPVKDMFIVLKMCPYLELLEAPKPAICAPASRVDSGLTGNWQHQISFPPFHVCQGEGHRN